MGRHFRQLVVFLLALIYATEIYGAQTMSALDGRVFDASGVVLTNAIITVRQPLTDSAVVVRTDQNGWYHVVALPEGTYSVTVEAPGFRTEVIDALTIDIGRTVVRDFQLMVATRRETVFVSAEVPLVERASAAVGDVVTGSTIHEIPLNGRHFIDLSLLAAGAVAPSQAGFSSRPIRGVGALAFNLAGNREEAVAFLVNGVSTNNLTFGSLIFEPPLESIGEFKVDRSALDAEYGHVSGAIAAIGTRSGTDTIRGDLFEFFRNDALDARNFFEFTSRRPHPFNRHQFGGAAGGPIWRGRTFFFIAYEGFRQRQGVDLNSLVLSDEQRAAATDPVIRQLIPLIPHANYHDAAGTPRFVGSAPAVVETDRWTIDLRHNLGPADRVQAFYGRQQVDANEPTSQGNSIPGFGHVFHPYASTVILNHAHIMGTTMVNEARFGRSRLDGGTFPMAALNPTDFGIGNGVTMPIGLPQMIVAGDLNFGGPGSLPQGRHDTSYILNDTFSRASGRHWLKFGGEYRHFINENFAEGTGVFNFPSVAAFLAGTANAFSATLGRRTSTIDQRAVSLFAQDRVMLGDSFTLSLGLRYEWHVTPTERANKFVVFDAATASLARVGVTVPRIYQQNASNVEPRLGVVWSIGTDRRTSLRAAYGRAVDEPGTTAVRDTAGNPPFAIPLSASGAIPLESALDAARPAGLAPATVDPKFRNAMMDSWNVNVQRQFARDAAVTVGYLGSHGSHLRISRNLNQPVNGVRPFAAVADTSPILPGVAIGNITQVESSGVSNFNGVWASVTKRLPGDVQVDASYTFAKSLDTNSLNSSGFAVQDSYDIANQYGLSDFDARHRFILSAIYGLPFDRHALTRGWQVATVVQTQTGNPINIVTSTSSLNGVPNTVRPDVIGPIRLIGSVDQWFDPSVFLATTHFGNLGRNVVIGPPFTNVDVSVAKQIRASRTRWTLRVDVFDVFNHPNFGSPGSIVGSPAVGRIASTRLPTGEAGSSRQIQLALKLSI